MPTCATVQGQPIKFAGMSYWGSFGATYVAAPTDVNVRACVGNAANNATVSSAIQVGDLMIAICMCTNGAITAPAGWATVQNATNAGDNVALGVYSKTAVLADVGATFTWTMQSFPSVEIITFFSATGATLSVDTSTAIAGLGVAASQNFTQPAITTSGGGELILNIVRHPAGTINLTGEFGPLTGLANRRTIFYVQPQAGLAPAQNWTSDTSAVWEGLQVAITSTSTLMPLQLNDLLILNVIDIPAEGVPAGFTFLGKYGNPQGAYAGDVYGQIWWKLATAGDLTATTYGGFQGGAYSFLSMTAWRNVFQAAPIEGFFPNNGNGTDAVALGTSGLPYGCVAFYIGNQDDINPAGFTIVPVNRPTPVTAIYRDAWATEAPLGNVAPTAGHASIAASYTNLGNTTSIANQHFTLNSVYNWGTAMIIICPAFLPLTPNPPPPTPPPPLPPPLITPPACIPFEIQSPGDMPDTGVQFTGQRLYITANLNVSGVPQVLTPILIIDGVEYTLPQITNTARTTIEIPISKFKGRFFDGVRLTGCVTGRIEIYRIEADVWLGEQQEG